MGGAARGGQRHHVPAHAQGAGAPPHALLPGHVGGLPAPAARRRALQAPGVYPHPQLRGARGGGRHHLAAERAASAGALHDLGDAALRRAGPDPAHVLPGAARAVHHRRVLRRHAGLPRPRHPPPTAPAAPPSRVPGPRAGRASPPGGRLPRVSARARHGVRRREPVAPLPPRAREPRPRGLRLVQHQSGVLRHGCQDGRRPGLPGQLDHRRKTRPLEYIQGGPRTPSNGMSGHPSCWARGEDR